MYVSQHGWSLTLQYFWNFEFRMPSSEPRKPKTKLVVNKIATENKIDGMRPNSYNHGVICFFSNHAKLA